MHLDSVISQVNEFIAYIFMGKLFARSSHVPVLKEIPFQSPIDRGHQAVASKVEFTLVNQQWVVNVLLNYGRAVSTGSTTNDLLYFLERLADIYSVASVSVFAWLNNPSILRHSHLALKIFNLLS